MKNLLLFLVFLTGSAFAQKTPALHDSLFSTYYHQRVTHFKALPQTKGDIIFLGNSITDGAEWSELFNDSRIKNRGVSGDISAGVIHRIEEVAERKPAKVFLMIGVNDLARNTSPDSVLKNILWISSYIKAQSPSSKLYVQSVLPVNNVYGMFNGHTSKAEKIKVLNDQLKQKASANNYKFVDLYPSFCDDNGKLNADLSNDGLHLNGQAYLLWKHLIYPHVFDLSAKPAILPQPQQLKWDTGYFPLYASKTIVVGDGSLKKEAGTLQKQMGDIGLRVKISSDVKPDQPSIELKIADVAAPMLADEAYSIQVSPQRVVLTANKAHGIFNGIQTLVQLMRSRAMLDACTITDWPAFSWRAYMVDVGRNFQSVELLKQQIDIMSKYKLNVFHFHPTEDIAWRLQIPKYPQLTAPEHMERNKGSYYSVREFKDLIKYCEERYITLVPEIDMPGHSAAFKRAMGVDMQTEEGLTIVKDILTDFCETYDVPYLHIGGDEVKITYQNFLPEVTKLIHQLGKKTIGWDPGGNLHEKTVRQLWMKDGPTKGHQYIDSRHLYINHMDPLESVTTIFNRQVGDRVEGDSNVLGGTLCLWHDRNVFKEDDIFVMNPVYPSMLAFAERIWKGGGNKGWVANVGRKGSEIANEFGTFERRLMEHKQLHFANLPFPYIEQSPLVWNIYGPYANKGKVNASFTPENKNFDEKKLKPYSQETGGTIVLRHWWYPLIKGAVEEPIDSTTFYATTRIWSEEDRVQDFWIGFNNLSRSPATDSPQPGTWDNNQSKIWVNGTIIPPPSWKRAGQKGNMEIPLIDEGYEFREPTRIALKKGWNTVLIKAPVASFKGPDWHNPVKWMFTFVAAPRGEE